MADSKHIHVGPVADSVPFDKDNDPDCGFTSDTVQEAIEELCNQQALSSSPSLAFGRSGNINQNVWLLNNEVASNLTGVPFSLVNGVLTNLWVGNKDVNTFDITLYEHDGDEINLTAIVTVSMTALRSKFFDTSDFGTINITQGKQIAARITSGSGKNIKVFGVTKGTII